MNAGFSAGRTCENASRAQVGQRCRGGQLGHWSMRSAGTKHGLRFLFGLVLVRQKVKRMFGLLSYCALLIWQAKGQSCCDQRYCQSNYRLSHKSWDVPAGVFSVLAVLGAEVWDKIDLITGRGWVRGCHPHHVLSFILFILVITSRGSFKNWSYLLRVTTPPKWKHSCAPNLHPHPLHLSHPPHHSHHPPYPHHPHLPSSSSSSSSSSSFSSLSSSFSFTSSSSSSFPFSSSSRVGPLVGYICHPSTSFRSPQHSSISRQNSSVFNPFNHNLALSLSQ